MIKKAAGCPLDFSKLSTNETDAELEKEYSEIKEDKGIFAEDAFDKLNRKYGI